MRAILPMGVGTGAQAMVDNGKTEGLRIRFSKSTMLNPIY